jgi:hypothetical protein
MGELLDRSAGFWRSHWKQLFQLYVPFHLTGYLLLKLVVLAMRSWFPLFQGGLALTSAIQHNPIEVVRQAAVGASIGVPIFALYVWVVWLASVAGSRYVIRVCLGDVPSAGGSVRYAFSRLGPATGSLLLMALLTFAVFLLTAIVGFVLWLGAAMLSTLLPKNVGFGFQAAVILLGFGSGLLVFFVGLLWFVLRFLLIAAVLAVEDLGAVASLKRCGQLVSGRIGPGFMDRVKVRATVLVTVMMLVLIVVTSLGSLPSIFVTFAYSKPWDLAQYNPSAVPERLLIPAELLHVGVQSLFMPLYMALACIFYLDMRVRREGLDLELRLEALQRERATP